MLKNSRLPGIIGPVPPPSLDKNIKFVLKCQLKYSITIHTQAGHVKLYFFISRIDKGNRFALRYMPDCTYRSQMRKTAGIRANPC